MNDDFVCYGTYSDKFAQCLLTCPDRHSCERITKLNRQIKELDEKKAEQAARTTHVANK